MNGRHLLSLADLDHVEVMAIINRGLDLKKTGASEKTLSGKTLAMLFGKPSTRTRVSFEVGMFQLGGHAIMLADRDSQVGRGEAMVDTARVLSRYVDAIMMRTFEQTDLTTLAQHATAPVINGLTDLLHPCQVLADLMTMAENFLDFDTSRLKVAWSGDGNNMAHSWINAAWVLGFELRLACPKEYGPDKAVMESALQGGANITLYDDILDAVEGAHAVTTDAWASMGQEEEAEERRRVFAPYQINTEVMAKAHTDGIFLHCLPAYRGQEVTSDVIDGPRSRIYDEAENRLHVQKAILEWVMGVS